jgi:hypothetical protein
MNAKLTMASEVTQNNVGFFPAGSEHRVHHELDRGDLLDYLDRAEETDQTLVACNECRRLLLVGNGVDVLHRGEER